MCKDFALSLLDRSTCFATCY